MMNSKHLNHATPFLKNLHWLPVEKRIEFKILLLTYKTINGQSADYLKPFDQGHFHYSILKELELTTMVVELFQLQRLNGGISYHRTLRKQRLLTVLKNCSKLFFLGKHF